MILKGNIIFTSTPEKFDTYPNSYILVIDGKVKSITKEIPKGYTQKDVKDFGDALIIPGFVDVHVHGPQFYNSGIGYSKELIPWLNEYTFPLESKFKDIDFAKKAYEEFINELCKVGTTRACVMATIHKDATNILIDLFEKSGLGAYIGKVNMDRNSPDYLIENTKDSIKDTEDLILELEAKNNKDQLKPLVNYIVSPRFVPSTTAELMKNLGNLSEKYNLPIQSHLDENRDEIAWVESLHPEVNSFCEVYEHYGLIRNNQTIMAHCIYNKPEEIELLKKYNIMVAHCAQSNFNLSSGIMPLRYYLNENISVGIGSDVGAGHTLDMRKHIISTITASKMYWVNNPKYLPLSISEAYYLATKGGGSFFGKVGSFETEYEFDALIVEDEPTPEEFSLEERLERFIYRGDSNWIKRRYVRGNEY